LDLKQLAIKQSRTLESINLKLARIEQHLGLEPDPSLEPVRPAVAIAQAIARSVSPEPATPEKVAEAIARTTTKKDKSHGGT
jgi:hypothetical protein